MFKQLRAAYALVVESLTRHARTIDEIDARTRAMFGLDEPMLDGGMVAHPLELTAKEETDAPATLTTGKKKVKVQS